MFPNRAKIAGADMYSSFEGPRSRWVFVLSISVIMSRLLRNRPVKPRLTKEDSFSSVLDVFLCRLCFLRWRSSVRF